MSESFAQRFKRFRESTPDELGRPLSQEKVARLLDVGLGCVRNWEKSRRLPDDRSRKAIIILWPSFFVYN